MDDLNRLQRERYLILRSLRVAHAFLNQLEAGSVPKDQCLPKLVEFLDKFAMEHFFNREEELLQEYARRLAIEAEQERIRQLKRDHSLGRAILASVQAAMRSTAKPREIRVDLGKLITQLSQSLVRGQQAVHTVEIHVRAKPGGGIHSATITAKAKPASPRDSASGTGDGTWNASSGPTGTGDGTVASPMGFTGTGDGRLKPDKKPESRIPNPVDLEEKYRSLLEELERVHLKDAS